jgi:hypothetical protein
MGALMQFMSPIDFYESNRLLWVPSIFMSPIDFYESKVYFMSPIDFYESKDYFMSPIDFYESKHFKIYININSLQVDIRISYFNNTFLKQGIGCESPPIYSGRSSHYYGIVWTCTGISK